MKEGRLQLLFGRLSEMQEWNTRSLRASFWRCYCPLDAGGMIAWGNETIPMSPGRACVIPPLTDFRGRSEGPFFKMFGHFVYEVPNVSFVPGVYEFELPDSLQADLEDLRSGPKESLAAELLMVQLIGIGLNSMPPSARRELTADTRIQSLVQEMRQRPTSQLTNAELAEELNMAIPSMIRLFKECMGTTPQKYLKNLRLQRAGTLLAHTDKSLEEIADECGFWDRNHFSRAFKAFFQVSPAAYRKLNRG